MKPTKWKQSDLYGINLAKFLEISAKLTAKMAFGKFTVVLMAVNVVTLIFELMQVSLTNAQYLHESTNCTQYQSCFNKTIQYEPNIDFSCEGAQSCNDSTIQTSTSRLICNGYGTCSGDTSQTYSGDSTYCEGSNSCLHGNISSDSAIVCNGYNSCSNSHIQLTSHTTPFWLCISTHSCSNSIFMCNQSYDELFNFNKRLIHIIIEGVFSGYSTSVYNNGNDMYLRGIGYYSLYGLTAYCTTYSSICIVDCYGNSCVGLTLVCDYSAVASCEVQCVDDQCNTYQNLWTIIDVNINGSSKQTSYDEMAILVDSILIHYDKNFRLLPNDTVIDLIDSNGYCKDSNFVFVDLKQTLDTPLVINSTKNENSNVCCLAGYSCWHLSVNVTAQTNWPGPTLYCAGASACGQSSFRNVDSVYVLGSAALYESSVTNFDGIVVCSAESSCWESIISNGSILVCMSAYSCSGITISNVQTVIAMGYYSLVDCQFIAVERIMLLALNSGDIGLSTYSIDMDNFELYCQNGDSVCQAFHNDADNGLYCYNSSNVSINVGGIDLSATNVSNLVYCSHDSHAPSMSPTASPTESAFEREIGILLSWLEQCIVILCLVLGAVSIILVLLSIYCRKRKHSKTLDWYQLSMLSPMTDHHDANGNFKDDRDVDDDQLQDTLDNTNDVGSTLITYIQGYGHKASHLVIVQIAFEMYDIFTDVSYLIELYNNDLMQYFYAFLTSMITTLIVNSVLLVWFVKNSFQHKKFQKWFFNNTGIIIFLMLFCLLTDMVMIVSLFTSQIFGHLIFYAPFDLLDIKSMKTASIISIFIEHLPQLTVPCVALITKSQSQWTVITMATLCVGGIDTFATVVKIVIWVVVMRQMKIDK